MGKIFDNPDVVFDEALLKPETQDMESYVDGICNIVEAQQIVAREYIKGGSVNFACPPLKAILHIMAEGEYEGKDINHPDIRKMFTREYLLDSEWYHRRLDIKLQRDRQLWQRHAEYIDDLLENSADNFDEDGFAELKTKRVLIDERLSFLQSNDYLESLYGTIGADWVELVE